jgi:hypothetical protein
MQEEVATDSQITAQQCNPYIMREIRDQSR